MTTAYTPSNIVLQTGDGRNLLSWDIVVGASSYSVQRSTDGLNFSTVGTAVAPFYLDTAVSVGTTYYYQVASVNASGTSSYSASLPISIVPCLPGQISLGYMRYLAQLRADKLNSQYITLDEWNSNINQSMYELRDILNTKFGDDYFMAEPVTIQLTGAASYDLPDGSNYSGAPALLNLKGVDVNIYGADASANASWMPLARFNWSDRDKYTTFPNQAGALNNIYQTAYRQMGNKIFIIPASVNQLIRLWYTPVMTQLLLDTDMLDFSFSGWSEYIINDAAMKGMSKEESLEKWNQLNAVKNLLIQRIETSAANRDQGQPNTVSNTRSSMGDPGFSNWGGGFSGGGGIGGAF